MKLGLTLAGSLLVAMLTGCGGSGGSGSANATGTLSVGLTDATVDMVEQVRLYVTGITVKPEGGPPESYDVSLADCLTTPGETDECNPVDLLALQDGIILSLISGLELEAGRYQWLRLEVDESFSYVVEETGGIDIIEVRIPSERGLQLSGGFVILAGENTDIVMDWDARKGLTNPIGQTGYILKPSIRIVDMSEYGTISGSTVDQCDDAGVVYVFEGDLLPEPPETDLTVNLDDIDNNSPDPLVTATVSQRSDGSFGYSIPYLPTATYTVALTCDDDPVPSSDTDLVEANDDIEFIDPQMAIVAERETVEINFPEM